MDTLRAIQYYSSQCIVKNEWIGITQKPSISNKNMFEMNKWALRKHLTPLLVGTVPIYKETEKQPNLDVTQATECKHVRVILFFKYYFLVHVKFFSVWLNKKLYY